MPPSSAMRDQRHRAGEDNKRWGSRNVHVDHLIGGACAPAVESSDCPDIAAVPHIGSLFFSTVLLREAAPRSRRAIRRPDRHDTERSWGRSDREEYEIRRGEQRGELFA